MPEFDLPGDDGEAKRKRGRPAHVPDERGRRTVEAMAGCGVPQTEIALVIGIDPKTLREHYELELARGAPVANAKVAGNLFTIATGPGREAVTAAIFWLKCRAGWTEYAPPTEPKGDRLGKKDAQALAAETADEGTGWANLLN